MNQLDALTQINIDDLVLSFGWQNRPALARALRWLVRLPARKFAELMLQFDANIADCGLADASRLVQQNYVRSIRLYSESSASASSAHRLGPDLLPAGPFLALSNHPGATDTLALFVALNRPDLKAIALDRPFLRALPNLKKQLLYVQEDTTSRMGLVRQVTSHLRAGGSILTFPAGRIEPDPDVYPGAVESLQSWTESTSLFVRLAPETAILPIVVRGVIWSKTARLPFLALKRDRVEREALAAAFQFIAQVGLTVKALGVRVQIGRPLYAKDLGTREPAAIQHAVLMEMQRLLECPPEGEGLELL